MRMYINVCVYVHMLHFFFSCSDVIRLISFIVLSLLVLVGTSQCFVLMHYFLCSFMLVLSPSLFLVPEGKEYGVSSSSIIS